MLATSISRTQIDPTIRCGNVPLGAEPHRPRPHPSRRKHESEYRDSPEVVVRESWTFSRGDIIPRPADLTHIWASPISEFLNRCCRLNRSNIDGGSGSDLRGLI